MKKLISLFLIAGVLPGCSVKPVNNITVIAKKDLYVLIFEWAAYREAAIVAYSKLHNVTRKQAEEKIDAVVKDVKTKNLKIGTRTK